MEIKNLIRNTLGQLIDNIFKIALKSPSNFKLMLRGGAADHRLICVTDKYRKTFHGRYLNDNVAIFILRRYMGIIRNYHYIMSECLIGLKPLKIGRKKDSKPEPGYYPWATQMMSILFKNSPKFIKYITNHFPIEYTSDWDWDGVRTYHAGSGYCYVHKNIKHVYHHKIRLIHDKTHTIIGLESFCITHTNESMLIYEAPKEIVLMRKLAVEIMKKFTSRNLSKLILLHI